MSHAETATTIGADAGTLWRMVSDVTQMGRWSPETTACRWVGAATGPAVGARFRGTNRSGWRRWTTTCTVTAADPGRRFAFDVSFGPLPVAHWSYTFTPVDGGTHVTEEWADRRPGWMATLGGPLTGVSDRAAHNATTMAATLAALKAAAESGAPARG